MSIGNPRIIVRLDPGLLAAVEAQIARTNRQRFDTPLTMSDWVRQAVAEKLAKMERGRRGRPRSQPAGSPATRPAAPGT